MMPGCRARPRRTRGATRTGPGRRGRCGQSRRSWPTPGTRAVRCGTGQRTDVDLVDPANTTLGHKQVQRWNLPEGWVISRHPAHAALVSEADFIAAQQIEVPRGPAGPAVRREVPHRSRTGDPIGFSWKGTRTSAGKREK